MERNKKKYFHNWYLKNKKKVNKNTKKYYLEHKEEILKKCKQYVKKHIKKTSIYQKQYRYKHRKKLTKQHDARRKLRLQTDISFRLKYNLRVRLHKALHRIQKISTTMGLLGCSIEFFKKYIESKFTKGMSWTNYGKWHIDHIKPCASFDLRKKSEQRKCFHYTNLQPLWAIDNLRKSNKDLVKDEQKRNRE